MPNYISHMKTDIVEGSPKLGVKGGTSIKMGNYQKRKLAGSVAEINDDLRQGVFQ